MVAPVFHGGELVAWCGSTVHQPDVGGPSHGGLTAGATSIFDEPLPVPPVRIVERDRIRRDIERGYLIRSRTPRLNALDLAGQIAANRASVAAIQALCARYGAGTVVEAMGRLVDAAEAQLRSRLAGLPDGRWRHVAYLEHGAPRDDDGDVYAVRLTAVKRGESLVLDFTDSSPQAPGSINAAYPALVNFTVAAVLIHLCGDLLWVPGAVARVVRIASREGTIAHARWPAGVAMSTATACQAIRVSVGACLARMLDASPELAEHVLASCQAAGAGGGMFSGVDAAGEPFGSMTLDELTGGGGATPWHDGADSSGSTTSPGAACANVEVTESYLPLVYLYRRELADSAGPGRHRGGAGCEIALRPHRTPDPVRVLSFAQGLQHPAAPGLAGGDPGRQSGYAITPADQTVAGPAGPAGDPNRQSSHPITPADQPMAEVDEVTEVDEVAAVGAVTGVAGPAGAAGNNPNRQSSHPITPAD
ncbi:MAG: N-methylhydantoinase, partial [Mycobacteriales bacterium]